MEEFKGKVAVITGAGESLHPARMKLAGRREGSLYDRLHEAQKRLARGEDGAGNEIPVEIDGAVLMGGAGGAIGLTF